jgi:hypothetical protein
MIEPPFLPPVWQARHLSAGLNQKAAAKQSRQERTMPELPERRETCVSIGKS